MPDAPEGTTYRESWLQILPEGHRGRRLSWQVTHKCETALCDQSAFRIGVGRASIRCKILASRPLSLSKSRLIISHI